MLNSLLNIANIANKLPHYFGLECFGENAVNAKQKAAELVDSSTDYSDVLSNYLSYRYWDEEKQLFFNDGDYIGFCLEISPIVGVDEGLLKNLGYFFNDELPMGSYLQFLLVASSNVEGILSQWQGAKTQAHPILKKLTGKRADFVRQMANSFGSYDGRIARDYRIFVNFSQKLEATEINIAKIIAFKDGLIKKFSTLNLNVKSCDVLDVMELTRDLVQMNESNFSDKPSYDPLNLLSDQILRPLSGLKIEEDRIIHLSSRLESKNYYARQLPKEFSLSSMIGLLGSSDNSSLGIPARFVISYTVASNLNKASSAALNTKGDRIIHAADQFYSQHDRNLKRDALEWKDINDKSKIGQQFLSESFNVMITAPAKDIELAHMSLVSLYNIMDFRLEVNKNLQLVSLLSMLPLQQGVYFNTLKDFKLTRICQSQEVIARLPIHAEWKGVPIPGVLLHARRGQLFNWNPFYRISSGNYNVCVFGPSGGGKSVFLQEMVVSLLSTGTQVFVLDIGQSFANICRLLDGEIIQFGRKSELSLNPFASFHAGMDESDKEEFLKCTLALLTIMCGIKDDDPHGSAELEKAIQLALLETNYNLDITSFARILENSNSSILKKFGATLYPYSQEGIYGKYFSGSTAASFKKQMTIFEFEEIKNDPKLLSIILQILLMQVTNQFLTGDRTKQFMIVVDEAWMLLDFAASFFAAFGRTVRKYGGSLVICVQNFMDLQKTQEHRAILENSTWTVMLKQDEKGLEAFKNSEAFKDMLPLIRSISLVPGKYSELLFYSTGVKVVGRLVLDNYSKVLYSTDAADFNYLKSATDRGIVLEEAIEDLAIKKYGSAG